MKGIIKFFRGLGPGVITGAADDDPSGIGTYSQAGAQFGYAQLWTALYMLPLLLAIQEACARIGGVTGKGIAGILKQYYNKKILYAVVFLLLIANTINIGADIGAMAAAAKLIIPINFTVLTLSFTVLMVTLLILIPYKKYANILKWLVLTLLMYHITVVMVKQPWLTLLKATFIPHVEFNFQFLFIITGVLGTTISPYLFFWQAAEVVEEKREHGIKHVNVGSNSVKVFIKKQRVDTFVGMFISEICTWSIIVVAATVLHTNGITDIKTAADAAKALEPLVQTFPHSGYLAKLIFSVGILGLGLLAVPVLSGSAAYVFCAAFDLPGSLNLKFKTAKTFYGIIILLTFIGMSLNFIGIDPFKSLIYAAVINGVIAVPLILLVGIIANNKKIMGKFRSGWLSNIFVGGTFIFMGIAAVTMFFTFSK